MGGQGRKPIIPLFSPKRYRKRCALALSVSSQAPRQGRVAAPSVCFAAARILLAAAPTAPPCFRHWRRSSPLPQRGSPWHVGQLSSGRAKHNISETVVLRCLGQRQLDKERCPEAAAPASKAHPLASCRASVVQQEVTRPAKASPFGRGGTEGDGEGKPVSREPPCSDGQALCQSDTIAVSELFGSGLALSVGLAPASSPKGGAIGMSVSFRLDERSTISRKQQCSAV